MALSLLYFVIFLCAFSAAAQTSVPGQILVSLKPGADISLLAQQLSLAESMPCTVGKRVAIHLNIWLLMIPPDVQSGKSALKWLRNQAQVGSAQYNHILQLRNTATLLDVLPDDPLFAQQWHLNNTAHPDADLDAPDAWNFSTGGVTPAGDTIVIAVIDGGIDQTHADLQANLWKNWAEIPGDGLDNDQNGFVDDYRGWNVATQNDYIQGQTTGHGTPVAGIIGAKANNTTGTAGINWNTKMMFVSAAGTEDNILAAYDYVLNARKLYNASNGTQGAFVVAINNSFGQNFGQPADAPLWCAAFDLLGEAGIISIAATANLAVNVDLVGDLPTGCPSSYLVSVTSLNSNNEKASDAAWGPLSIDIASYGKEIFTTASGSYYGSFSGTSFAAPQVAGAVGLLYAAPCPNLISVAKINPGEAAKRIRELLLLTSVPTPSLFMLTQNGGRLNLNKFLQTYQTFCITCVSPFGLAANTTGIAGTATLSWYQLSNYQTVNLRWRVLGSASWSIVENVPMPFVLNELQPCTTYEFALQATCSTTETTDWSASTVFVSSGCCSKPGNVVIADVSMEAAVVHWNAVPTAIGYRVRMRPDMNNWQIFETTDPVFTAANLSACTTYEVQVQTRCATGGDTPFTDAVLFTTKGCGSCLEANYCTAELPSSLDEWISAVKINDWTNSTLLAGPGYQNFALNADIPLLTLQPNKVLPTVITPGFAGSAVKQYYRIYIDFNADGDFGDAGELAFNPGFAHDGPMSGNLTTPAFMAVGMTRMRVIMKFKGNTNTTLPGACESFQFGQIEDYCVLLDPTSASSALLSPLDLRIFPQPATDEITLSWNTPDPPAQSAVSVFDAGGKLIFNHAYTANPTFITFSVSGWPAGVYVLNVQTDSGYFTRKLVVL